MNAIFNFDETAIAMHIGPTNEKNRVFSVSASPPKVVEYDVSNIRNHYIKKIFIS